MDAQLRWRATESLALTVAGQNLFRARHVEFFSVSNEFPSAVRRSVYAKLTWTF
jgi:hypothetical protein